jgi:hypothetical protein
MDLIEREVLEETATILRTSEVWCSMTVSSPGELVRDRVAREVEEGTAAILRNHHRPSEERCLVTVRTSGALMRDQVAREVVEARKVTHG